MKQVRAPVIVLCFLFAAMLACAGPQLADTPALPGDTPQLEVQGTGLSVMPTEESVVPSPPPALSAPGLGEKAREGGYYLSALAVEDPTQPDPLVYEPVVGMRLVAVEIVAGNEAGDRIKVNPLYAAVVDSQGREREPVLGKMANHEDLELTDLRPGQEVRGWISFELPDDVVPAYLKYTFDLFKGPQVVVGLR